MALALALALALAGCRESQWDPKVAGLVNGRPIATDALEKVLELGFYPPLAEGAKGGAAGGLSVAPILNRLIDERLMLAEAAKAGFTVSPHEVDAAAEAYTAAWFDSAPPPSELGGMKEAVREQLLLRKLTDKVVRDRRLLSADRWREFWAGWPKEAHTRYKARLLVIPPLPERPKLPAASAKSLGDMVEWFADNGLNVMVTDAVWVDGRKLTAEEAKALEAALKRKRPTQPFRQPESWVVFEPLEVDRGLGEADSLLAAKAAFEELEGEKAFRQWLATVRGRADIMINPAYLDMAEPRE